MNRSHVPAVLIAASVVVLVGWRASSAMSAPPPMRAGIVLDRSLSMSSATQCAAATGLAEKILSDPGFTKGAELLLFTTGDRGTQMEPMQLGEYKAPHSRRALSGKREFEEQRSQILRSVEEACRNAGRANVSPVALAVQRALAALHQHGCGDGRRCILAVSTDGVETTEGALARAIRGKPWKGERLLATLDNESIAVHLCGIAETALPEGGQAMPHTMEDAARLQRAWVQFFKVPDIQLAPFCPKKQLKAAPTTVIPVGHMTAGRRLTWL